MPPFLKQVLPPALLAAVCAVALAVAAMFYPRLTDAVGQASGSDYRERVEAALEANDLERARNIAQYAVRMRSFDPEAHTVLARVHLAAGDRERARARYEAALAIDTTPGPIHRPTRQPYYYALARLDLGRMAIDAGDVWDAVRHFELARGYAHLEQPEFAAYHDVLSKTYAAVGQWTRALDFGEPTDEDLAVIEQRVSRRDVEDLAAVCEARRAWQLGRRVAQLLLDRDPASVPGHRLAFRAALDTRQLDTAAPHLQALLKAGAPAAHYWEGRFEEARGHLPQAALAFLNTDSRSHYRPFALALAHRILTALPESLRPDAARVPEEISAELDTILRRKAEVYIQNTTAYTDALVVPVGFDPPSSDQLRADAFPLLTRWHYHNVTPDALPVAVVSQDRQGNLTLFHDEHILQLCWTENAVPFTGFEGLQPASNVIPGWVEPRYVFGRKVPSPSAAVAFDGGNLALKVSSPADDHVAQLWTVPMQSLRDGNYLAAGRIRAQGAKGHLAWDSKDPLEVHTFNHYLADQAGEGRWTWYGAYQRRLFEDQSVRLLLGIFEDTGEVWFDDLLLVPLVEPTVSVPDSSAA